MVCHFVPIVVNCRHLRLVRDLSARDSCCAILLQDACYQRDMIQDARQLFGLGKCYTGPVLGNPTVVPKK